MASTDRSRGQRTGWRTPALHGTRRVRRPPRHRTPAPASTSASPAHAGHGATTPPTRLEPAPAGLDPAPAGLDPVAVAQAAARIEATARLQDLGQRILADAADDTWSPADLVDLHERMEREWRSWRRERSAKGPEDG